MNVNKTSDVIHSSQGTMHALSQWFPPLLICERKLYVGTVGGITMDPPKSTISCPKLLTLIVISF